MIVQVVFGADGSVASATVIVSSGATVLDNNTRDFVYGHWKNPSLANQTLKYTVTYDPSNPGPTVDDGSPPAPIDPNILTATLPPLSKPKETALALYKKHIQTVLAYYWSSEVKKHASDLEAGTVKLRFIIHADGSISDIAVVEGNSFEVLKRVGQSVLLAGTPYRPFTPELLAEVGDNYTDTKTFTVSR